jgi:kinesin family member 3B
VIETQEDF